MENIRDNSYKSPEEIRRIQQVVGFLGQVSARPAIPDPRAFDVVIERTDISQLPNTASENRWCDMGTYLERE